MGLIAGVAHSAIAGVHGEDLVSTARPGGGILKGPGAAGADGNPIQES